MTAEEQAPIERVEPYSRRTVLLIEATALTRIAAERDRCIEAIADQAAAALQALEAENVRLRDGSSRDHAQTSGVALDGAPSSAKPIPGESSRDEQLAAAEARATNAEALLAEAAEALELLASDDMMHTYDPLGAPSEGISVLWGEFMHRRVFARAALAALRSPVPTPLSTPLSTPQAGEGRPT